MKKKIKKSKKNNKKNSKKGGWVFQKAKETQRAIGGPKGLRLEVGARRAP